MKHTVKQAAYEFLPSMHIRNIKHNDSNFYDLKEYDICLRNSENTDQAVNIKSLRQEIASYL